MVIIALSIPEIHVSEYMWWLILDIADSILITPRACARGKVIVVVVVHKKLSDLGI